MTTIRRVFAAAFTFKGRAGRLEYLLACLIWMIAIPALAISTVALPDVVGFEAGAVIFLIIGLPALIASTIAWYAAGVRRFHDLGLHGSWAIWFLLPFAVNLVTRPFVVRGNDTELVFHIAVGIAWLIWLAFWLFLLLRPGKEQSPPHHKG